MKSRRKMKCIKTHIEHDRHNPDMLAGYLGFVMRQRVFEKHLIDLIGADTKSCIIAAYNKA